MDHAAFKAEEQKLFDAIRAGDRDAALAILVGIDTAVTGRSDFAPGGMRRMFAEADMDQFIGRVKNGGGENGSYNAIRFGDGETKLYIWCEQGQLRTEWTSVGEQAKLWEEVGKMGHE